MHVFLVRASCELVTAIPARPRAHTPRNVFAFSAREIQALPGRIFNPPSLSLPEAPVPSRSVFLPRAGSRCCGRSRGPASPSQPRGDSASRRPPRARGRAAPPARHGKALKGRTPAPEQVGSSSRTRNAFPGRTVGSKQPLQPYDRLVSVGQY